MPIAVTIKTVRAIARTQPDERSATTIAALAPESITDAAVVGSPPLAPCDLKTSPPASSSAWAAIRLWPSCASITTIADEIAEAAKMQ